MVGDYVVLFIEYRMCAISTTAKEICEMRSRQFPESDWQKLRVIRERALQRYCAGILAWLRTQVETENLENAHKHYLAIYKEIDKRDRLLADLFDDWRRSSAIITLMKWTAHGLVTQDEFESLSEETRAIVQQFGDVVFYREG
jgi:hypothetical protein